MNVVARAAGPSLHHLHTLIFFVLTLACLAWATVPPMLVNRDRSWERRVYWTGVAGAAISIFLACLPDWTESIGAALVVVGFMAAGAYVHTPYIKIRGKIYAFHVQDSQPDPSPDGTPAPGSEDPRYDPAPDSYGGTVTAQKFWWLMIWMVVLCVGCIVVPAADKPWFLAPGAGVALVLIAAGYGHIDASWGYAVARGQRVQFAVLALITAGVFTVLYLIGYAAGRRWPLRRTDSSEYRAHPRYWKDEP